uniref:pectinesterase n=1 Tax=Kalanchoe fedtschenkoi TaxID=63787 RepID=A0A7N0UZW5_KALFE
MFVILLTRLFVVSTLFASSLSLDCKPLTKTFTVDQSGNGDYKTIQSAMNSVPHKNDQWLKFHIRAGTYLEKVSVLPDKGCVILEGEGREKTIISWDDHSDTDSTYTFEATCENFVATQISFVNSYNLKSNEANRTVAPALAVSLGGDKHAFYQCGFFGYQDTIHDDEGRHYFKECYIEGAVDFIYGAGQSFYEKCDINATGYGYITAQGREAQTDTNGFVFEGCNVFGLGPTYLGRAYRAWSRVIYHSCTIDVDVMPLGWDAWNQVGKESNLDYVESDCKGAHYDTSKRIPWLKNFTSTQLADFTRDKFINQDGWIEKQPN